MAIALPVVAADLVPILRSVAVTTPTTLNPEVKLALLKVVTPVKDAFCCNMLAVTIPVTTIPLGN